MPSDALGIIVFSTNSSMSEAFGAMERASPFAYIQMHLKLKRSLIIILLITIFLREVINIAVRFVALGTAAVVLTAVIAKLDRVPCTIQGQLNVATFLRMPIDSESPPSAWSETAWAHTVLHDGIARAKRDISRGRLQYYLYGLTSLKVTTQAATLLAKYNINLELAGCEIGTPKYHQDMLYNEYIQSKTTLNVSDLLTKSVDDSRRRRGFIQDTASPG